MPVKKMRSNLNESLQADLQKIRMDKEIMSFND